MDRPSELLTLERLERRRSETWLGLWLAPLLTILAQALLLGVLADERVGWLARAAVLAAALGAALAALWSLLRAHAREVQYSEAIDAELAATAERDYADIRPAALARPRRRGPNPVPPRPEPETGESEAVPPVEPAAPAATAAPETEEKPASAVGPNPGAEAAADADGDDGGETAVIDPDPTPPPRDATPPPPPAPERKPPREHWVSRWDRHIAWWAAGETHAKAYMAWAAALGLFMLADVAAYLATV